MSWATAVEVDWSAALCAQSDPEAWFAEQSGWRMTMALRLCGKCPLGGIDGECLRAAMREPEPPHGIRAGMAQEWVRSAWMQWRRSGTMPEPYRPCPVCGKTYTRLGQHVQQRHPSAAVAPYRCEPCGFAYATEVGLSRHQRRAHKGES